MKWASLCKGKGKDTIRVSATNWVEGGWQIEDAVAFASHAVGWGTSDIMDEQASQAGCVR